MTSNNVGIKNEHGIDLYNNIYGLAQLINECDVIVTTSNLNAHIAGALGKKTICSCAIYGDAPSKLLHT